MYRQWPYTSSPPFRTGPERHLRKIRWDDNFLWEITTKEPPMRMSYFYAVPRADRRIGERHRCRSSRVNRDIEWATRNLHETNAFQKSTKTWVPHLPDQSLNVGYTALKLIERGASLGREESSPATAKAALWHNTSGFTDRSLAPQRCP